MNTTLLNTGLQIILPGSGFKTGPDPDPWPCELDTISVRIDEIMADDHQLKKNKLFIITFLSEILDRFLIPNESRIDRKP